MENLVSTIQNRMLFTPIRFVLLLCRQSLSAVLLGLFIKKSQFHRWKLTLLGFVKTTSYRLSTTLILG